MKSLASLLALALLCPSVVWGQGFVVDTATVTPQTLGDNDTGTITAAGSITLSGSSVNVTISGSNAALINSGTLLQSGSGRAVEADGTGITIWNNLGALIETSAADAIRAGSINPATTLSLDNKGTIQSADGQAVDWNDILTGSNAVTNSGLIRAIGSDAVRLGVNGTLLNTGTIRAEPVSGSSSDGLQLNNSGAVITNSGLIAGRHGITGGNTVYAVTITNSAGGLLTAINGSGINIDGLAATSSATVFNDGIISGVYDGVSSTGDGDGLDVDGILHLTNTGTVQGLGAFGAGNNSEGIAAGGGDIINRIGAEISGLMTSGSGGVGNGILIDDGNGGSGVAATTVTNAGLIRGYTGFGIKIVGSFNDTVTNQITGTIRGQGVAVQTGAGDDQVINRGSIVGDGGAAVDLEDGDDSLIVQGGSASIGGDIDGGTGTNTLEFRPGFGNTFSYDGGISNFSVVEVHGGTVLLSGNSTYAGSTTVYSGILFADNTAGSALGTGNVTVASGAQLGGSGTINGAITVLAGGTLTPGNSPGMLTVASLDLLAGSTTLMQIVGAGSAAGIAGSDYDKLSITTAGGLGYGGSLDLDFMNTVPFADGTTFDLFGFSGSTLGHFSSVGSTGNGSYYLLTFSDVGGVWTAIFGSQLITFSELTGQLRFTPVPEIDPATGSSALSLVASVLAMIEQRRRRRLRQAASLAA